MGKSFENPFWKVGAGLAIVFASFLLILVLDQLFAVRIWRHDAMYYLGNSYEFKLREEGRWLNYILFPYLKRIPGWLGAVMNLAFFQGFCLILAQRIVLDRSYALLISFLFVQILPLYDQILWPATTLPSMALLFLSALVIDHIRRSIYYLLAGILFLGGMANLYFLLPLLHFPQVRKTSLSQGVKEYILGIFPYWIGGFIAGSLFLLILVRALTGQTGLAIASWREPHPIGSFGDLLVNLSQAWSQMVNHLESAIEGPFFLLLLCLLACIGVFARTRTSYLVLMIMTVPTALAVYAMSVPIGILIDERTIIGTWMGLFSVTMYPQVKRWQFACAIPMILLVLFNLTQRNGQFLRHYSTITNTLHEELVRVAPLPGIFYSGIVFIGTDEEFFIVEEALTRMGSLKAHGTQRLQEGFRWKPVAHEAGFEHVVICDPLETSNAQEPCREASTLPLVEGQGLYVIRGVTSGEMLVISWNPQILRQFAGGSPRQAVVP
jgi:hypothetical protein